MGVIKRQGIKQSVVTYMGVAIGMVNVLFVYPAFLKEDQIGIISYVRETAAMLSLFVFLGSADLIVRFFPHFKDDAKKNNGFLFIITAILTLGCLFFTILCLIFKHRIYDFYGGKEEPLLYLQFAFLILPFTVLIAFGNLFSTYAANFQRIVVPAIFNEFFPKIGVPLLVLAFYKNWISFEYIMYGSLCIYVAVLLGQIWYLNYLGKLHLRPDFRQLNASVIKEMSKFSLYGFLGSLGSRFSSEFINFFMLGTISTLANTGIYTIAYSISNVIDVPRKAISRIVSPLIADKFKEKKLDEIEDIYHRTSLNQLIVGLLVFLSIWVSIDQIFQIMPNGESFATGKYIVLLLGLARIVDMMTGVNSEILSFSKDYRFNFYLILFMAVVHICSNLFFIKNYGLIGVGIATLTTLTLFNLAKYVVLKWRLGMQPFTRATALILGAAGIAYFFSSLIPLTHLALIDAAIRSGLFAFLFVLLILWLKIAPDVTHLANNMVENARKYF
ncbi:MAG: hypothetical protein GC192_03340 [Bacteroidetes bacterium]|nr:hypothetical protein [Bacteroidota bacterium]